MLKTFAKKNSAVHGFIVEKIQGTSVLTSRIVNTTHKTCSSTSRTALRTKNSTSGCFSGVLCSFPPTDSDSTNVRDNSMLDTLLDVSISSFESHFHSSFYGLRAIQNLSKAS